MLRETWLYKVNPSLKLFLIMTLFIGTLFIQEFTFLLIGAIASMCLFLLFSGLSIKRALLFFLPFFFIFLSSSAAMIFFGKGTTLWFEWELIRVTKESFYHGLLVGFRTIIFAFLGLIFTITTKPINLFYSLMQQLKLSPKYAYSFMGGMRLIPVMMEEFQILRRAMKVRGVDQRKFPIKLYLVSLLSQSIRRAYRIAIAMEAKNFSGNKKRTFYYSIGFSYYDFLFVTVYTVLLVLIYYFSMYSK